MNIRVAVTVAALGTALLLPATAAAKGASAAKIEGAGLGKAIVVKTDKPGDPSAGSALGRLAEDSGFFPLVFGQTPDPTRQFRPKIALGPRYRVTWTLPGPNGTSFQLRQDIYPYGKPYPASYMKPGQSFWGGQRTHGGWYTGSTSLRSTLLNVGLPTAAPSGDGDGNGWASTGLVTALVVAAALGLLAAATFAIRRRPRPALD